ncbi:MAG: DUF3500 domain-containing protein [Fuerstiella sp.]|nr:DUF3500 domain-containing protein [Fuerstiella sp.]
MSQLNPCVDVASALSRRSFVRTVGGAAVTACSLPLLGQSAVAAPSSKSAAESAVKRLYDSLSNQQSSAICFPFEHQLRKKVSANWGVTDPEIGSDFYTDEQRELISRIVSSVTSEDGHERLLKQMDDDNGGIEQYQCAIFGEPGTGQFQWELTGRHLTLRADGDSVENTAFGGPIVYGHGEEDIRQNLFYYQTQQANEVFAALDSQQRKQSLLRRAPHETRVQIQGGAGKFRGIRVGDLSEDQKQLVESVVKTILAPYRSEDVDESMSILKSNGGLDELRMAFYQQEDIGNDKVWDIWRIEGPAFVVHFRGAPHVHAYINIGVKS